MKAFSELSLENKEEDKTKTTSLNLLGKLKSNIVRCFHFYNGFKEDKNKITRLEITEKGKPFEWNQSYFSFNIENVSSQ